ncbi:nitroreductase family protein [Methanoregula sp.]|uniref:nitroreductase family protein n=1 Tax=Methanoregula sp. TaxID=2052170 RepID=UPI000CC79B3D|nr:nitroreductase family protein [Methanoregula sp.]PKG32048.1 MAG: nitroreductase [Methanoregula sp.]
MCTDVFEQRNVALDQILAERRSHRVFRPEYPSEYEIHRIIHAGLLAPFAAAAVGTSTDYFRRFFVFRRGSKSLDAAIPLVKVQAERMADELAEGMKNNPGLRQKAMMLANRLEQIRKIGVVPGVGTAPFFLVVTEKRGFPPVGPQSLAHCMENMWLKATALGLGFQLVSITAQMADDPAFCTILGIEPGAWDLMGCAVGYSEDELSPSIRPPVEDVTRWLD